MTGKPTHCTMTVMLYLERERQPSGSKRMHTYCQGCDAGGQLPVRGFDTCDCCSKAIRTLHSCQLLPLELLWSLQDPILAQLCPCNSSRQPAYSLSAPMKSGPEFCDFRQALTVNVRVKTLS